MSDNNRSNFDRKRDESRKAIESTLASGKAFWVIVVIVVAVVGWAIVGTFVK